MVKQFPEEAVLRRRAYFHTLDLTKDAPSAFAPPTARRRLPVPIDVGRPTPNPERHFF